jgi:hypothetical protein
MNTFNEIEKLREYVNEQFEIIHKRYNCSVPVFKEDLQLYVSRY